MIYTRIAYYIPYVYIIVVHIINFHLTWYMKLKGKKLLKLAPLNALVISAEGSRELEIVF